MRQAFYSYLRYLIFLGLFVSLTLLSKKTYELIFSTAVTTHEIPFSADVTPVTAIDVERLARTPLFGQAKIPTRELPLSSANYHLKGVFWALNETRRYAVIEDSGDKSSLYVQGAELEPGVNVADIQPDRIVLDRNGQKEVLELPRKCSDPC